MKNSSSPRDGRIGAILAEPRATGSERDRAWMALHGIYSSDVRYTARERTPCI